MAAKAKKQTAKGTADGIPVYCAHDRIAATDSLVPNPDNPNRHPDDQISLLAKIIGEQGWRQPITVSTLSGMVVKGHGRLMAAQRAGLDEVPVDDQAYETAAQERADLIADNRIAELSEIDEAQLAEMLTALAKDDIDMDLTGFTADDYAALLDNVSGGGHAQVEEDDYDEPANLASRSRRCDLWILGEHRLVCGDSGEAEAIDALMAGERADMMFTDPPYGVSIGDKNKTLNSIQKAGRCLSNIKGDTLPPDELYGVLVRSFTTVRERALSDECAVYVTAPQGGGLGMMMMMMRDSGLEIRHILNWVKNSPTFSIGRLDYDYQHEPILFTWTKTHKRVRAGDHQTSCWFIDKPRESKLHPTMKPIALVANALLNSSEEGDVCIDPFGGSGSTLIACEQTGRRARMMEIDPHYCDVIVDRYIAYTGSEEGVTLVRDGAKTPFGKVKKTLKNSEK
jgi:DNA modification methylase